MAIIFELWAECYTEQDTLDFITHFDGLQHTLVTTGQIIHWSANKHPSWTNGTPMAVSVASKELSTHGVQSLQDAIETTEAGLRLYKHLLTAPPFKFARIDWEAGNIPLAELNEYLEQMNDGSVHFTLSCVVDDSIYEQLGRPKSFKEFRLGYKWNGYRGETYYPLASSDQLTLNQVFKQLFPSQVAPDIKTN